MHRRPRSPLSHLAEGFGYVLLAVFMFTLTIAVAIEFASRGQLLVGACMAAGTFVAYRLVIQVGYDALDSARRTLARGRATGTVLCDEHDVAAVHELSWVEAPGTPDEAGRSVPFCELPGCAERTLAYVERNGRPVELLPV